MEEVKRIEELEEKNSEVVSMEEVERIEGGENMEGSEKMDIGSIWEEVQVEEIDKLFEAKRFRAKNWDTAKIKEALEALEPGKVYKISVQKFVEAFGKDGVKQLTLQGQKKKIRQVLRRMMDYFELRVSFDGNIIHIMRLK